MGRSVSAPEARSRPTLEIASASREATRDALVVIGNGMASYKLCERLAASGGMDRYEITVFGEEARPAYDRVHLTDFLAGRSPEQLALASRNWYRQNKIDLQTGRKVVSIDRERREIVLDGGVRFPYCKLVLATGSRPFVPTMEGSGLENVFVYRTVEDLAAIRECANWASSAAVIGGGLLGLEAARALQALGVECHILEYAPHVLCTQLDPRAGRLAGEQIESLGMRLHTSKRVERIEAEGLAAAAALFRKGCPRSSG